MKSLPNFSSLFLRSESRPNGLAILCRLMLSKSHNTSYFAARNESTTESAMGYTTTDESDAEFAIEELRNVSGLPPNKYRQYHGLPHDRPFKDLIHKRQRYASFGSASAEDPRIMWPTRSLILAMEDQEREEGSLPLSQRIAQVQAEQRAAEEEKMARRKRIESNMEKMPKWIKEYEQKHVQAQTEAKERAVKKEALLEEAREYFGYKIQPNDPKFQKMVEEKEENERLEAKKRKREEKAKKLAAKMAEEMARSSKSESKTTS